MSDALLKVDQLQVRFDGVRALAGFSCSVKWGEILGLIGPNGAGKTTLFNVVSGFIAPSDGRITFKGSDITGHPPHRITTFGISRTFQNLRLFRQVSVLDNVLLFFQRQPGEQLRNVFFNPKRSRVQETENRARAMELLDNAGLKHKANDPAEALSFGQQKLLSLVCCLAADSELLLLDEPVAGIASEMVVRILDMIRGLPAQGKSVIIIEHTLDAMMEVCPRVIFMDAGVKVSEGTPDEIRNDPKVVEAYLG